MLASLSERAGTAILFSKMSGSIGVRLPKLEFLVRSTLDRQITEVLGLVDSRMARMTEKSGV